METEAVLIRLDALERALAEHNTRADRERSGLDARIRATELVAYRLDQWLDSYGDLEKRVRTLEDAFNRGIGVTVALKAMLLLGGSVLGVIAAKLVEWISR